MFLRISVKKNFRVAVATWQHMERNSFLALWLCLLQRELTLVKEGRNNPNEHPCYIIPCTVIWPVIVIILGFIHSKVGKRLLKNWVTFDFDSLGKGKSRYIRTERIEDAMLLRNSHREHKGKAGYQAQE